MSLQLFWHLLQRAGQTWIDHKAARVGAALAFYSVLSLAPLLILVLVLASALWGAQAAQGQIVDQIGGFVGDQGAQAIQNIMAAAALNKYGSSVAGLIGILSLIVSASAVFGELQDAMNTIWHVEPRKGKPLFLFARERLLSIIMVLVSGTLMILSLAMSTALAALSQDLGTQLPIAIITMGILNFLISFAVLTFLFALIFKTVPQFFIPWQSVVSGALLTSALFIIGKGLIGLYLGRAGVASSYGAAGSIIVLLVWIYYSAQILLFGAEFTYAYSRYFTLHTSASKVLRESALKNGRRWNPYTGAGMNDN